MARADVGTVYFRHLQIARLYVLGRPGHEIAETVGISHGAVRNFLSSPEGKEMVQETRDMNREVLHEYLSMAEREAVKEMIKLATHAKSEKIRFDASQHLLNMAGERGKPKDRSESQSLNLSGDAASAIIANALRDPGVRDLLEQNPQVRALLAGPPADSGSPPAPSGERESGPEAVPEVREQAD